MNLRKRAIIAGIAGLVISATGLGLRLLGGYRPGVGAINILCWLSLVAAWPALIWSVVIFVAMTVLQKLEALKSESENTILRNGVIASIILVIAALHLVIIGAQLRFNSPLYEKWLAYIFSGYDRNNDPGPGLGIVAGTWWEVIAFFWVLVLSMFIGPLILLTKLPSKFYRIRWLSITFSLVFAILFIWITVVTVAEAIVDFRWGFWVLGFGYCLMGAGLLLGVFEVVRARLINRENRANAALISV